MLFCSHCGTKLESESKFCPSCGQEIIHEPDTVEKDQDALEEVPAKDDQVQNEPVVIASSRTDVGSVAEKNGVDETPHESPPAIHGAAQPAPSPVPSTAVMQKKKMSGCTLAALIGGGVFAFFFVILVIVMAVALTATSGFSGKMDEWFVDVRANDVEGAYAMTSTDFRKATSLESFRAYLNSYPLFKNSVRTKYAEKSAENGIATLRGTLVDAAGVETKFAAQLVKEGDEWKVQLIQLPNAASGSPMNRPGESPAAKALEKHLSLLRQGNLAGAYEMTSAEFKAATAMETYGQYVNTHPVIADVATVEYEKGEEGNNAVTLDGFLVDSSGQKHRFQAQVNRVNSTWVLHGFDLPDPPVSSGEEPPMEDFALRKVSHPEYYLEYWMPDGWVEEFNDSRFVVKPGKGDKYERRVWMAVQMVPNQSASSKEEISTAMAESLVGLGEVKIDGTNLVLTTVDGNPVKHENEIPAGQYGNFMTIIDYHFTYKSTRWKGIVVGSMRHDDKGKFHYIISVRSEESCWEELEAVVERFLVMKVGYGPA